MTQNQKQEHLMISLLQSTKMFFHESLYVAGASSFRSATPSPPLSSSTGTSTADEGIVKDLFSADQMRSIRSAHHKPVSYFKTLLHAKHYLSSETKEGVFKFPSEEPKKILLVCST